MSEAAVAERVQAHEAAPEDARATRLDRAEPFADVAVRLNARPQIVAQRAAAAAFRADRQTRTATIPGRSLAQRKAGGDVIQRVVPAITQSNTNRCWAAAGWAIHRHLGGTNYATEQAFVTAQASAGAQTNYTNNVVEDIDNIIGSGSATKRLVSTDTVGKYFKSTVTASLNANGAIVANVNNNHYIILTSRTIVNGVYSLTYMDPATGASSTAAADLDADTRYITGVGGVYAFSVLYYLS